MEAHKLPFAHQAAPRTTLLEVIKAVKPTALIGVAAVASAFTKEVCEAVCENTDRPLVFALSNPTSKAECTAEQVWIRLCCFYSLEGCEG